MVTSLIVRLVAWSVRRPVWVVVLSLVIAALSGVYVAQHFKINTDISKLVDAEPQFAALGHAVDKAFPQRNGTILAVVEAPAPEFANAAAHALTEALRKDAEAGRIGQVAEPGGGPFFEHNGLLFLSPQEVTDTTSQLASARPLVNELAKNPSLTGLATTLSTTLGQPLLTGQVKLSGMAKLLARSAATADDVLAGKPAAFSWRALVDNDAARQPARAFVTVQPVVNYGALKAGAETSQVIRDAARSLDLEKRFGAAVRLTGEQPLADDEFASVEDGAALNGVFTLLAVLVILWLALRSKRMIGSVLVTLFVGLVVTAALGLAMVGSLNMISVAFMVLFVGLGVDFSIQYGVKYREERFRDPRIDHALIGAAHSMGMPLALATAAVAASFFSFIPTAYRGVSELGLIAGVGMFVALLTTLTLLPALLRLFAPPGESKTPGFPWLAPVDDYLDRHRKPILIGTLVVVVGALPLLAFLRFDFNPLHLKDPNSESMATLLALKDSPEAAVNDDTMLRRFAKTVKAAEPGATGGPISILHSADTIIDAFLHAALWSIISITILLWVTLRRFGDVLRTLVPLLVSGVVTLELCVVLGMPLNFANIIALPLMLGVGVAFKVYFVMAWRAGQTGLLHSSLTHAVLFSAATTATAFGSLWLSHHPGTSSMGKLLALALTCTLIGAVVFQPVLMGKPRVKRAKNQSQGINE
ncbi:MMPL family transporter [Burkholderia sp. Ac-20345]|uniref:MMPL family transporter n=1 Tax=Burkholderia sp. Ac-20345 TaxID=2703891 RepID=UPI00197B09CD|nr:MMPL family transporter [Burkholderia sp. Ac-20345]MBN3777671.1 MMPL family transporter [Burkholderia sp. Ac-20345]